MIEPSTSDPRDARTLSYTGGLRPTTGAGVACGLETSKTPAGQAAVLSAINMLARVHPALSMDVPDVPLIVPCPFSEASLAGTAAALARAANPDVKVTDGTDTINQAATIGIGPDAPSSAIYAGGLRWTARTGLEPQPLTRDESSLIGLGMATALACGAIFRKAIHLPARMEIGASLWTMNATALPTGPPELAPVGVGSVWMIGAGAVGSGLAWWLQFIGSTGHWTIVDADHVDTSNLNRSLAFFAHDAGLPGQAPVAKAVSTARLFDDSTPIPRWWDDFISEEPTTPDVLIPIANERGVRASIACLGHPAILHATTSPNWSAELHRHLLKQDDCISCRLPESAPRFRCATAAPSTTDAQSEENDAALPFLSGAAGLLLLAGLKQLEQGHWATHPHNHWRWWFDESARPLTSTQWACDPSCTRIPSREIRRGLHGHTRWAKLDQTAME